VTLQDDEGDKRRPKPIFTPRPSSSCIDGFHQSSGRIASHRSRVLGKLPYPYCRIQFSVQTPGKR
jgi:hypothetical protein